MNTESIIKLLFLIVLKFLSNVHTYKLTPMKWFDPIYVKNIGPVKLFCRFQVIQYDIEMGDMMYLNRKLGVTLNTLDDICKSIQFNHICTNTIDEIKFLISNIVNNNQYLKTINSQNRKRRTISEISHILQKTIILTDNSYGELKHSLDELQSLVNHLEKSQNKILDHLDYANFNALTQITILNLRNYIQMYDSIMDIFVNKNYRKLVDLMPIENLRADLRTIHIIAKNESCALPIDASLTDLSQLLNISTINSGKMKSTFSIEIKISTVFQKTLELMEGIPIPFAYEKNSYLMLPIHENYLVNLDKTREMVDMIPLTMRERANCNKLNGFLLCSPNEIPFVAKQDLLPHYFIPNYDFCGNQLKISNVIAKPALCNIRMTLHLNQIKILSDTKYYIYIVNPTNIFIQCTHDNYTESVISSSLLTNLNSDCTVKLEQSNFFKHSKTETSINQKSSYVLSIHPFNRNDLIKKEYLDHEFKQTKNLQPEFGDLQSEIRRYNKNLRIIEDNENQLRSKSNTIRYFQYSAVMLIIFSILLCIFLLYKKYKHLIILQPRYQTEIITLNNLHSARTSTSTLNI